jgi:hypothetical protein
VRSRRVQGEFKVSSRSAEPHPNERQRRVVSGSMAQSPGRGGGQASLFGTAEARRIGCTNQRNPSTGSVQRTAEEGTSIGVPKTVIRVDIDPDRRRPDIQQIFADSAGCLEMRPHRAAGIADNHNGCDGSSGRRFDEATAAHHAGRFDQRNDVARADVYRSGRSGGVSGIANWARPDGRPGFASVSGRQHGRCQPKPTTLPFGGQ